MTLYIDTREERSHKRGDKPLHEHLQSPYALKHLDYGDIMFTGNGSEGKMTIGIERKRFRDLIGSINSGRLSGHQLIGLTNSYDIVFLLVEGIFKVGKDGYLRRPKGASWIVETLGDKPLPATYMYNYLTELSIFTQVTTVFQPSIRLSALWVDGTYAWFQRPWESHHAHEQFHTQPPPRAFLRKPRTLVRMIKEIDDVGWEKAVAIGRRYANMKDLIFAEPKELMETKGIGKVLAHRILQELRGAE
uniref:Putative nuclease n=1 Tax=viral metagenome TaxID=1070528 RepID=A0A6M3L331_9ZZZZ